MTSVAARRGAYPATVDCVEALVDVASELGHITLHVGEIGLNALEDLHTIRSTVPAMMLLSEKLT